MWRNRKVDPAAIRRTTLFTVEGERDDICSVGQTVAALLENIRTQDAPLPRRADAAFAIGKAETLREGGDVAIIANGVMVARALAAAAPVTTASQVKRRDAVNSSACVRIGFIVGTTISHS